MDNPKDLNVDVASQERRLHLIVRSKECPGFLEYLGSLPNRAEGPLIRAILFDWYTTQQNGGTLDSTTDAFLRNQNLKARSRPLRTVEITHSPKIAGETDLPSHSQQVVPLSCQTGDTFHDSAVVNTEFVSPSERDNRDEKVEPSEGSPAMSPIAATVVTDEEAWAALDMLVPD